MPLNPLTILIVDDDRGDRKQIMRALKNAGMSALYTEAESIDEAVEARNTVAFDCAIVDYRLPGQDGLAGVSILHQILPYAAIIMVTGQGDETVATEAMKRGASDYLPKNYVKAESIKRCIENAVVKAGLLRTVTRHQEELDEVRARLQAVLDSPTEVAIIALDCKGTIKLFNHGAERMLQYRARDVIDDKKPDLFLPATECARQAEELSAVSGRKVERSEIFDSSILPGDSYSHEYVFMPRDQKPIDVRSVVSPMLDSEGKRIGTLTISIDISKRKLLEEQLQEVNEQLLLQRTQAEEANGAKTDFLSAMSHEIRTPMNAILGMADLLWESELETTQRKYVEVFRRAGVNLLTLVNDILDLSKIEARGFELESVDFHLSTLLERTVELMSHRASAKNIKLTSEIAPGTPARFVGDPFRLQQILDNIVGNAIKFTQKGEVIVAVSGYGDGLPGHLKFSVSDTGIGIPEEKLMAIFEDFTQAETSTTRRFGGTGLGLGICRRLVNRMGGEILVESLLGKGSTFAFDVSLSPSDRITETENKEVPDFHLRRVLVLDDNPTDRLILMETCAGWGMSPTEVATGGRACELVLEAKDAGIPFALMLLGGVVPANNSLKMLEQILAIDAALPVILTSSDSQSGEMTRAIELGAAAYIPKPVRRAELLTVVSRALRESPGFDGGSIGRACQAAPDASDRKAMRILVAEDSEDNRFLVSAYLKNRSYELTFVNDGQEALNAFTHREFDLVLMDIQMPVMDGLAATAHIRALENRRSVKATPILALTANALLEDARRGKAAGCTAHLSKPISKEKLIAAIESFRGASPPLDLVPQNKPEQTEDLEITIPEGFEEHSRNYITARRKELAQMVSFPPGAGITELRSFGHNMKGTGTSFGFPEMTRLGAVIEDAAKLSDRARLAHSLAKLNAYVEYASQKLSGQSPT